MTPRPSSRSATRAATGAVTGAATGAATQPAIGARAAAGVIGCAAATWLLVPALSAALGPTGWAGLTDPGRRVDEVLLVLLAAGAVCLAGWLALGCALTLLSTVPGAVGGWSARAADHLTPRLVRKALTVALTTSTASLALPAATVVASAAPTGTAPRADAGSPGAAGSPSGALGPGYRPTVVTPVTPVARPTAADVPVGGATGGPAWTVTPSQSMATPPPAVPATTTGTARPPVAPAAGTTPGYRPSAPVRAHDPRGTDLLTRPPRPTAALLEAVTVRRGDTLWSIAARHLGSEAGDAEIAQEWPRWYAANRAVVGADPDLIQPGTQLVPPSEGDPR